MKFWDSLVEYRSVPDRLSDLLPWARLVAPGVILNKDDSYQKTFSFRGPDLYSATRGELVHICAKINNALQRLSSNWILFAESQRIRSLEYPESKFPDPVTQAIDDERRKHFQAGNHYENLYYLTLVYIPPTKVVGLIEDIFIEQNAQRENDSYLKYFQYEVNRIFDLFKEVMKEAIELNDEETLTYLHSCISTKRHVIRVPEIPMYLDAVLVDSALTGGLEPRLGNQHLRTITITGFPGSSIPGILDTLNKLRFEYRWMTRFIALDKELAKTEIKKYRRNWFSQQKGLMDIIQEKLTKEPSVLTDDDMVNKKLDGDIAAQELGADLVSYGYFTATITILDPDYNLIEKKIQAIEKQINSLGFATIREKVNAVEAWRSSLPGEIRANVRRPLLNTLNLAHLFPLSATWAGPRRNEHLNAPALMVTQTPDSTLFRFDLMIGDVGHTGIFGPTGSGKSVLLALIVAQFFRYPNAQVYFFDKEGSSMALNAGLGGDFYDLANERDRALALQPLADIDKVQERTWASEWIYQILEGQNVHVTPNHKKLIWEALESLATAPRSQRHMSGLVMFIQDDELKAALHPYTEQGPLGRIFDSTENGFDYGRFQVFEMDTLMKIPSAIEPALGYLFHQLEHRFTGVPTLLVLDECWLFLKNPYFVDKIMDWLKTLRKSNVYVIFATQTLKDVEDSPIAFTILDACSTKIYLPNPNAKSDEYINIYKKFDLNEKEIDIIAKATRKRDYYYKSEMGSRKFELALEPFALAYCAASQKPDREMVKKIIDEKGKENFNREWLQYKDLEEYIDLIVKNGQKGA